ncbi:MAG: adenylate/guanylate cyclase domain-containing protein [Rhizobiaceae bacterium]
MAGEMREQILHTEHNIDPSPRSYAPGVSLLGRSRFDLDELTLINAKDVERWLFSTDSKGIGTRDFIVEFACKLMKAGLGVDRFILNVGTLHPQAYGYAWHWNTVDGICDEIQIDQNTLLSDAFRKNPICRVIENGETIRVKLSGEDVEGLSPLMKELAASGFSEYVALPLSASGDNYNAVTLSTCQANGFSAGQLETLMRLLDIFALHVDRHIISRIAKNISYTYLGREAGEKVVSGTIKRGAGVSIDAIVWSSDMRGFSKLSEKHDSRTIAEVLNNYFSVMAEAAIRQGGDVLKFIGDGMLAVFPLSDFASPEQAASAAAIAAQDAVKQLAEKNEQMSDVADWPQMQTGIGLHIGEVFFGNIGAERRLDFTVIGQAVNVASRIEGLCKPLKRSILVSSAVADLLEDGVESLGVHALGGMQATEEIFALPDEH